jgi:nitroreductase
MLDVFDAVRTLLAVREYKTDAVPPDVIHRVVEAGRLTGSSRNGQPWHFIVVEERERLKELGGLLRSGPYAAGAAFAIALVLEESPYGVSDASRAAQSMCLVAWEEGVGSNWIGFNNIDAIKPVLGIPADYSVLGVLSFGYPVKRLGRGKKNRKPLGEVAHRERFGTPFS